MENPQKYKIIFFMIPLIVSSIYSHNDFDIDKFIDNVKDIDKIYDVDNIDDSVDVLENVDISNNFDNNNIKFR